LLNLDAELSARVVGQPRGVAAVSDAIRRSRAGISDPHRPTGTFLFLGPTGVGKTELAKALAHFLFDDERAMVRIDMSEYGEKFSVSRLVGAPPGYVGYEEGGQLTEAVRRRPYSVILLDEVEKAHPEVFDLLLQVFDDGRLTDGQGRTVDFRNAIIVMTSNLGSSYLADLEMDREVRESQVMNVVRQSFKPEFLNRIDDIVLFNPLGQDEIGSIVEILFKEFAERLESRRITFTLDESAKSWLSLHGFDPAFGARPLRRLLQKSIGDRIATMLLKGEVTDGDHILIKASSEVSESLEFNISR
jgi:ATP-dependent Clp protease ATP-binding subunit ClpB